MTQTNSMQRGGAHVSPPTLSLNQSTIADPTRYRRWRAQKLARVERFLKQPFVQIRHPMHLAREELFALGERVDAMNFVLYRMENRTFDHHALIALCRQVGLDQLASNPFSHASGVSEIQVADDARQRAYIPYSDRALNWHTDGYYNPPQQRINGFAMHTMRPATDGGENRMLDHEVLYLLLRDRDPALAACLFAQDAMTIPPGTQSSGTARAAQTVPVFSLTGGGDDERLHMGFTLRSRHIHWKPSSTVRAALAEVRAILNQEDNPYILTQRFAAGEGVICNNVLHNRAAFSHVAGEPEQPTGRLVLRARFYDSINIRLSVAMDCA